MLELLSPAGTLEKLEYAITYGADAVYVGGGDYSLRNQGTNFTLEQIAAAVSFTRRAGKKLYVALNVFTHQDDLKKIEDFITELGEIKPDAVIIADPGIFNICKKISPGIARHISTQANVTNLEAARFWADQGASRITLARELKQDEIKQISKKLSIETEIFVHGAMCLSYSGRCWLSQHLTNRGANKGDCAQSCRWNYALVEEERPDEALPVFEEKDSTFILSSKDLCLAEAMPGIIGAGVSAVKIEGRAKSIHYVATVTKTYRQIIDKITKGAGRSKSQEDWIEELEKISHRSYSKGFFSSNGENMQVAGKASYIKTMEFIGAVEKQTEVGCFVRIKNKLFEGDELEVLTPESDNRKTQAHFHDEEGNLLKEVNPNNVVFFKTKWPVKSLLRRKLKDA